MSVEINVVREVGYDSRIVTYQNAEYKINIPWV